MNRAGIISGALALLGTSVAQADVHPFLTDKYVFQAGAFFSRADLNGAVNSEISGDNPVIDFDKRFGISKSQDLAALEFFWRFTPRWSAQLQYFAPDRSATAVLDEDVAFGEAVFEQGSSVTASSGFELLRLFFGRNFSKRENMNYGVGAGLHRIDIDLSVSGNAIVNGEPVFNETRAAGATAPLPNIGAWYDWSPSPKWLVGARIDWLDASVGDYSGGLLNAAFGVNYRLFEHMGLGAKYQVFGLDLEVDKPSWRGNVDVSYEGAYVYVSANWN
ncbi:MAG: hypothetical protein L0Y45_00570 [Woeseiaceae bacterium]|nr:hypothetical protein [Woeseiaceae bacterium]